MHAGKCRSRYRTLSHTTVSPWKTSLVVPCRYDIANHFCECAGFDADFRKKYPNENQRKRFLRAYVEAARPDALRGASVRGVGCNDCRLSVLFAVAAAVVVLVVMVAISVWWRVCPEKCCSDRSLLFWAAGVYCILPVVWGF